MTLEEIARRVNVSTITVSRVLNHSGVVKDATRKRVEKAVEELKYCPNLHARSLAGGKSRSIGVIVANIENPFFREIYRAVETRARGQRYDVIVASTDYSSDQLAASVRSMISERVAGLVAIVSGMDPRLIEELNGYGIPVAFYDVDTQKQNVTNIQVNYRLAMKRLADYLYCLGHRRMGVVGHHTKLRPSDERFAAALESLSGFPDVQVRTASGADSLDGGRNAARVLLSAHPEVTAIVCVNDFVALGAMREIRERGLRIPEDISLTGFDNVTLGQYLQPALTSFRIPSDQIGHKIYDALVSNQKAEPSYEMLIDPELMLRDSTGPALSCARS